MSEGQTERPETAPPSVTSCLSLGSGRLHQGGRGAVSRFSILPLPCGLGLGLFLGRTWPVGGVPASASLRGTRPLGILLCDMLCRRLLRFGQTWVCTGLTFLGNVALDKPLVRSGPQAPCAQKPRSCASL